MYLKRAKCLRIDLTIDLQAVANLVTANRGSSLGALFASNVAIVKALICKSLLHRLNRLIGAHRSHERQNDDKVQYDSFHGRRFNEAASHFVIRAPVSARACDQASHRCQGWRNCKGTRHFLELGPQYTLSGVLYFAGLVTAAITRNERYHEFYAVFFLVQTVVMSFVIFHTLV